MSNIESCSADPAISVSADIGNVSAVTEFVETTVGSMGLGGRESMALTLASEEIFAYLCMASSKDSDVSVSCSDGAYYVRLDFLFDDSGIDIGAFNLTSKVSHDDEESLDEMGLVIASRMVDRFCFRQKTGKLSRLTFICDKQYESVDKNLSPYKNQSGTPDEPEVVTPDASAIEVFAQKVWALSVISSPLGGEDQGEGNECNNSTMPVPAFFEFPGKVVDMVRSGEFAIGIALDSEKEVCGGIIWTKSESKTVECFGPYLFGLPEESETASKLVDFCLADIARTATVGILSRYPASLPAGYFELLGEWAIMRPDGSASTVAVSFRQTKDDPGCTVKTDAAIESFLRDKYSEFAFPREIITEWDRPSDRALRSVLSVDLDRKCGQATVRPVLEGDDCEKNIADHLKLLQGENVSSITFEIDLGESSQVSFIPALLKNSFRPTVLLPYAGRGDIVTFQLDRS